MSSIGTQMNYKKKKEEDRGRNSGLFSIFYKGAFGGYGGAKKDA